MIFKECHGAVWLVRARPSMARQHVTQYGNWTIFRGRTCFGTASHGAARRGTAKRLPVGGITGHFRR